MNGRWFPPVFCLPQRHYRNVSTRKSVCLIPTTSGQHSHECQVQCHLQNVESLSQRAERAESGSSWEHFQKPLSLSLFEMSLSQSWRLQVHRERVIRSTILVGWGHLTPGPTPYSLPTQKKCCGARRFGGGGHYCEEPHAFPQSSLFIFHSMPDLFKQAQLGLWQPSLSAFTFFPLPIHAAK